MFPLYNFWLSFNTDALYTFIYLSATIYWYFHAVSCFCLCIFLVLPRSLLVSPCSLYSFHGIRVREVSLSTMPGENSSKKSVGGIIACGGIRACEVNSKSCTHHKSAHSKRVDHRSAHQDYGLTTDRSLITSNQGIYAQIPIVGS
jgi:hypothetical protein